MARLADHLVDHWTDNWADHLADHPSDHLVDHQQDINLFPFLGRGCWKDTALLIRMSHVIKAFMAHRSEWINLSRRGAGALKGALSAPVLLATPD